MTDKKKANKKQEAVPEETSSTEEQVTENTETTDIGSEVGAEVNKEIDATSKKLEETEAQLASVNDMLLRLRADFDNYRKRNAQIRTDSLDEGKVAVISEMLKTLDNFENALAVDCTDTDYANGMQMIFKMLKESLESLGVEEVSTDSLFDPKLHEAVMQGEAEGVESGTIIMTIRKGYKYNSKVIRPAMVSVAK